MFCSKWSGRSSESSADDRLYGAGSEGTFSRAKPSWGLVAIEKPGFTGPGSAGAVNSSNDSCICIIGEGGRDPGGVRVDELLVVWEGDDYTRGHTIKLYAMKEIQ